MAQMGEDLRELLQEEAEEEGVPVLVPVGRVGVEEHASIEWGAQAQAGEVANGAEVGVFGGRVGEVEGLAHGGAGQAGLGDGQQGAVLLDVLDLGQGEGDAGAVEAPVEVGDGL
ncbi:hypothetical protein [Streptomyces sp. CB02460]|uniref:hypothetical protein n=1 Tax=Streptomyces sp. CB02460 TaxID=1703941 RepID=UPI00093C4478|nr:hypothetical protein [Streptomyces sp. CB02460]OKJ72271.1 hypothetical protein AMK30_21145 [Streptomyces sp. CB02460]